MGPEPELERAEDLVAGYLRQFEHAARSMAPGPRDRAVRTVRRLLRDDLLRTGAPVAEVRRYLQDLGPPARLREQAEATQGRRGSSVGLAIAAVILTTLCWPLGVPMLWYSRYWTRTEKLIGALLVPGGVPAAFYLWPALLRVGIGVVWGEVAGTILPLLSSGVAFYLVVTFVLRVDDEALGIGVRRKPH
ncbi:MAG: hypothetical protein J2P43_14320 [Candidatus Dormibacteraeota bacterium]|nr:hypothetical protein [Candidatus Dormibacteraeota bacterium]